MLVVLLLLPFAPAVASQIIGSAVSGGRRESKVVSELLGPVAKSRRKISGAL